MAAVTTLGLGKTMEKKLHSVGIHSAEELIEIIMIFSLSCRF